MKNIKKLIIPTFTFFLIFVNILCLNAQERQLKRIIKVREWVNFEGKLEIDTTYEEVNIEDDCFLTTISIDTLKIDNDTVWEKHYERTCGEYEFRKYVKYNSNDTVITRIKNLNDSLVGSVKRYKIGYRKEKEVHIPSNEVFIIDNSIPFRLKKTFKDIYEDGTIDNESKIIYCKLIDNSRFYTYDEDKKKWILRDKFINVKGQKRTYIKYYTYGIGEKWSLFIISFREKTFLNDDGQILLKKYYESYSLKPYMWVYYYYEYH